MNPEHYRRSTDPVPVPDRVTDLTERHGWRALLLWEQIDRDYRSTPEQRSFSPTLPMELE